jgi:hypothetical protein
VRGVPRAVEPGIAITIMGLGPGRGETVPLSLLPGQFYSSKLKLKGNVLFGRGAGSAGQAVANASLPACAEDSTIEPGATLPPTHSAILDFDNSMVPSVPPA